MKTKIYLFITVLIALSFTFSSCKKEKTSALNDQTQAAPTQYYHGHNAGLGPNGGYPSGTPFYLPPYVKIIGDIRGGIQSSKELMKFDKQTYHGPFPCFSQLKANWTDYGTGTFVNLYIKFYNILPTNAILTLPGGLIFVDSTDVNDTIGIYQKGFILQAVNIQLPAQDTAFACIRAYCINLHLMPSTYDAVYFIGPVTNNPDLDQMVTIMQPKQYPFGSESDIQSIIWDVTDYGLSLTTQQVAYLNGLP